MENKKIENKELDWFDTLILKAKIKAHNSQSEWVRETGLIALRLLEENKENLKELSNETLKKIIGSIASENLVEAKEEYYKHVLKAEELIKGMESSGDRIIQADEAAREAAKKWDNIIKKITGEIARLLLALLIL